LVPSPNGRVREIVELRWRELVLPDHDLLRVCERLQAGRWPWLLDSAATDGRLGRYSFAGADPYLVARVFGERIELDCSRRVRDSLAPGFRIAQGKFLEWLRKMLPAFEVDDRDLPVPFPLLGGAVGYWGYEMGAQIEAQEFHGRDDLGLPDATMLFVDRLVAMEHASGRCFAIGLGFASNARKAAARAESTLDALSWSLESLEDSSLPNAGLAREKSRAPNRRELLATRIPPDIEASFDAAGYRDRVLQLKSEIAAGNVYEANLTRRMDLPFEGDAWSVYCALRRTSPAPFASFMDLGDAFILGSSPERFLRVSASGDVESRPIKGTRPRGRSAEEDSALGTDLASSEKDRAENLMIVDLVRNDLGRVCEFGSVHVPELMSVEPYASVFQLVSTVVGKLRSDRDRFDLVAAAFPPGSMTGAPKIAAMRLLDELEPVRRGVYSGALGYLDVRGGMDLAVVIRTLLVCGRRVHLHVGGAVVADSDPQEEYEESLDKARAIFAALAAAKRAGSRRERRPRSRSGAFAAEAGAGPGSAPGPSR
jgi:aminodeoxychorismate synthase component I